MKFDSMEEYCRKKQEIVTDCDSQQQMLNVEYREKTTMINKQKFQELHCAFQKAKGEAVEQLAQKELDPMTVWKAYEKLLSESFHRIPYGQKVSVIKSPFTGLTGGTFYIHPDDSDRLIPPSYDVQNAYLLIFGSVMQLDGAQHLTVPKFYQGPN